VGRLFVDVLVMPWVSSRGKVLFLIQYRQVKARVACVSSTFTRYFSPFKVIATHKAM